MLPSTSNNTSFRTQLVVSALIFLGLLVSWLPQLDAVAQGYLNDTIGSNAIIYGVVRTLNGVISVVQTTEVGVGIASIELGQILDPINDLVERFSSLLMVTLVSLGVAKVLLIFSASIVFKVFLTLAGIISIASIFLTKSIQSIFIRLIAILFIIRFILSVQIGMVWLFDYLYFNSTGQEALSVLQAAINVLESLKETVNNFELSDFLFGSGFSGLDAKSLDAGMADNIATAVITLSVGMLFKSILIPVGTIWFGYKSISRLL